MKTPSGILDDISRETQQRRARIGIEKATPEQLSSRGRAGRAASYWNKVSHCRTPKAIACQNEIKRLREAGCKPPQVKK